MRQSAEPISKLRARFVLPTMIASTLLVFGGVILVAHHYVREGVIRQIAGRDGEILHAVAVTLTKQLAENEGGLLDFSIEDSFNQIEVLYRTSEMDDVLAARLFDAEGNFVIATPANVKDSILAIEDLERLRQIRAVSHYYPDFDLSEAFNFLDTDAASQPAPVPILEVLIPLHEADDTTLAGVGQFLIEGTDIQREIATVSSRLRIQSLLAFVVGGGLIVLIFTLSFRKLQNTNWLLRQRTQSLLRANEELKLAAKSSAVGAITAHLFHGLKNPVFGLHQFAKSRGRDENDPASEDWREAAATTEQIQAMINKVVGVLREEDAGDAFELSLKEIVELLEARVRPLAQKHQVHLGIELEAEGALSNRTANLVNLILLNLTQNAIEATPPGKSVTLRFTETPESIACSVQDEGGGIDPQIAESLFVPCRSTKPDGCGIGLAICKQLANHLEASLELKSNARAGEESAGALFVLEIPRQLLVTASPPAEHAKNAD